MSMRRSHMDRPKGLQITGTFAALPIIVVLLTQFAFNTPLAFGQSDDASGDFTSLLGDFQRTLDELCERHRFPGATAAFILRRPVSATLRASCFQ